MEFSYVIELWERVWLLGFMLLRFGVFCYLVIFDVKWKIFYSL